MSPTTAAAALATLRRRGLVLTRPRSGAVVSWRAPVGRRWPAIVPPGMRDLARGNPDPRLLPDLAPALARIETNHHLYGEEPADQRLLRPVAGTKRFTAVSERERWAAIRSVSKSLGPDLRLAAVSGDRQTISRVQSRLLLGPQWVSHLLQRLVAALWSDSKVAAQLERAAVSYSRRRGALVDSLAAQGIPARAPSGLNVWIAVPDEGPRRSTC